MTVVYESVGLKDIGLEKQTIVELIMLPSFDVLSEVDGY